MKQVYSVREVAEALGINLQSAYALTRREDFPVVRVSAKRIVIPKEAFNQWLNSQRGSMDL